MDRTSAVRAGARLRRDHLRPRINIPEINAKRRPTRGFAERAAINAPIQGAAADIIRRAMIRMPAALRDGLPAKMLLQVHDELVFEAPRPRRTR